MKRLEIEEEVTTLFDGYTDSTIVDVISYLEAVPNQYREHKNFRLCWNQERYSDAVSIGILGTRMESAKEYERRCMVDDKVRAKKKGLKEKKEIQEKRDYERLKKKFEG